MHELSIARSIVDIVSQAVASERTMSQGTAPSDVGCVRRVCVYAGALTAIDPSALRFSFQAIVEGTSLEGCVLEIRALPLTIYCARCRDVQTLPDVQALKCPQCGDPSNDVRSGRELEVFSIEIDDGPEQQAVVGEDCSASTVK